MELVEVAAVGEFLTRQDSPKAFDELSSSSISFSMFEPPLSNSRKFSFKPSGYYIHRDATFGIMIDTCDLFGCNRWILRTGKQCSNYIELLGSV